MPTQSFFVADDKIPISQKKVSIQAENGLSYELGQQVNFVIPASTGFMMPSETYLRMDVRVQTPSGATKNPALMLDTELGANVLIRDIRISSGGAQNILLEELQNVNVLSALKYDYETNDNLKKKRAMTEGTVLDSHVGRGNQGTTEGGCHNVDSNPYFTKGTSTGNASTVVDGDYETVKCLLTLPTGIFQNDKIFPLQMTEGLRIEIILESANKVFRQLTNTLSTNRVTENPFFGSLNGSAVAPDKWNNGSAVTSFYLSRKNNMTSLEACPFTVGDEIFFLDPSVNACSVTTGDTRIVGSNASSTAALTVTITDIEFDVSGTNALTSTVETPGGLAEPVLGQIKITCASTTNDWTSSGNTNAIDSDFAVCSMGVESQTNYNPTCSVNNVELIVQQVEMPSTYVSKMNSMLKAGGAMNYDFLSYTNYKYSQLKDDRVVNIRLPIGNSRCKSILAIPTDASVYTAKEVISASGQYRVNQLLSDVGTGGYSANYSTRPGLVGIADHVSQYQFIYDGKLNPNRKVPLNRISVNTGDDFLLNQQNFIEQEKALHQAQIDPLSFRKCQENFFIGRALSLSNGVYDARGKDFNLQVEYQESQGPSKPHLWNCWVAHLRRIVVRGDSIALEV